MAPWQRTHPWITFRIDFQRAPWELWLLCGEAVSKCEHVAGTPLAPDTARELMTIYLAKGAAATTAIEGNTLTEDEVRQRIAGKLRLPPSREYLGIEVDNITRACNEILQQHTRGAAPPLTPERIGWFNRTALDRLELDEHICPGELRTYGVGVADYRGAPAEALPELMGRLCEWLNSPWIPELSAFRKRYLEPMLKAVVAHLYLAWIHPFGDGNGRTARLVEFYILVTAGVPFPAAHLLSNHYNQTRSEYYRQLAFASRSGGEVLPFCLYALRGFVDQLREQIDVIRQEQAKLFWESHVRQHLGDSGPQRRRRQLVLDLAAAGRPVPRERVTDISPPVARAYARLADKTLARDLDALERLGLIERTDGAYRAKIEIVLAYLPPPPRS